MTPPELACSDLLFLARQAQFVTNHLNADLLNRSLMVNAAVETPSYEQRDVIILWGKKNLLSYYRNMSSVIKEIIYNVICIN